MSFDRWWWAVGSGIRPAPDDDAEEHAWRIAKAAWEARLPERLDREQAAPLCILEGMCERLGECHDDCDCNPEVQMAWRELRELI